MDGRANWWSWKVPASLSLSICLSVCLFIYLSICLSVGLSVYLTISLLIYTSIFLSICLSIYLLIYLTSYLSVYVSIYRCVYLSIYRSIDLSIFLSFYLSVYLSPNFQKWSERGVLFRVWLRNVLRATTAFNFWALIWPDGSAPAAVVASLYWAILSHKSLAKHSVLFSAFSSSWIFFPLSVSLLTLLFSDCSHHCCCICP